MCSPSALVMVTVLACLTGHTHGHRSSAWTLTNQLVSAGVHFHNLAMMYFVVVSESSAQQQYYDYPADQHQSAHYKRKEHHRIRHHLSRRHLNYRQQLRFSQTLYTQSVPENIPLHTSILKVQASDPGADGDGVIKYHVSDTDNFKVDEEGVLYNIRPLDYERTSGQYRVQISAESQGAKQWGRRKVVTTALIYVTDASEPPYFDSSHYYYYIPEFAAPGTFVGKVIARDDDNDFDSYSLDGVEPPNMFSVDTLQGIISVGQTPLGKQWVYLFQARATDYQGHVTSVPVTVYIIASNPSYARLTSESKEENRHKPVFPECTAYDQIHVKENMTAGSPVVLVLAKDNDVGKNGIVSYSLINDFGSFAIHSSSQQGQVTTTRRYDQTLATDHRSGTTVLRVTASDLDAGENAHVTYSLRAHHPHDLDYFSIDSSSGIMTLRKPLDDSMANSKTFELSVQAEDQGRPALSSTVPITITVVSSGELPPTIVSQNPLHPIIPENTTENTPVVTVCARSNLADSPNVYFTLINGNTRDTNSDGTFALRRLPDSSSACVDSSGVSIFVATRNLDYETVESYNLLLQVVNDQNARVDKQLLVDIVDVNDNAPLLQLFDGSLVENAERALITTIKAVDKDTSPQFRQLIYKFDATATEDVRDKFELKPNGELWTTKPLDREEVKQYRVPIQVTDGIPGTFLLS
ncbi:neural-cadherin-like [Penaeus chinensis]|uniref:neural-cadherin-like n=1 Tax=Penaeus chinensis TaxID=139456 RepID=UPI001FB7E3FA|nr:neural-cadherin-like [Penaeus chinensis]